MRHARFKSSVASALAVAGVAIVAATAIARPNRYGHSDREERHMFPAVSSGPLDPAWSPDGKWIAFSMRGDIWKVPADGGEAIALTRGPNYHFEPAWSPDGRRIALSVDAGGNLEIGIVDANGGDVQRVASHARVDLEPTWSRDGQALYFVSARSGGWRIFRHDLATGADTALTSGIQPSVSPDGRSLAYEQNGLRVLDLSTLASRVVREEEAEYRVKPVWTPDGKNILYVTEDKGSNDIRIISATGGDPIELTIDGEHHEMSPSPSPDGKQFAFVAFRAGVPTLFTADIAGGRPSTWREVKITSRRAATPTGRLRVRVVGPNGRPMPARVYLDASDGRSYTPNGLFHRAMMVTDRHYFHTPGESEVDVPVGRTTVEAIRGWEYSPKSATVDVRPGVTNTVTLTLDRLADLPARGWYSGDDHVHDLHQGFGLSYEAFYLQLVAEDLHVTNALIHMDGTRLMGRWSDLTGKPHPLSTPTHILQYAQEFRGGLGHVGMLGVREFTLPLVGGQGGTAYAQPALDNPYLEGAIQSPRTPAAAASTLIAMDVALGLGDFYDITSLYSDELYSAAFYYRLLNAGFRLPAGGGTDQFSDVWRDPPPGSDRTFAYVTGPLTVRSWLDALKRGRTFTSTGPLLFLEVNGHRPGDEIALAATPANGEIPRFARDDSRSGSVRVKAEALSITPLDSLQIIVNGDVVQTVPARDKARIAFDGTIAVPQGGWIAARVLGPHSKYIGDDYAFAHTSPVYVVRDGRKFVKADDVQFLAQTVDAIWTRVERSRWQSDAERDRFRAAVDSARAVYRRLAE
jgi:TolB protein